MSRKTFFAVLKDSWAGREKLCVCMCLCADPLLDPSLFFPNKPSSPPSKPPPPADTGAAVRRARGGIWSPKIKATQRAELQRRATTGGGSTARGPLLIFSINSRIYKPVWVTHSDVTVMPKPDFTSRPEGDELMISAQIATGGKTLAAWQQTPP